MYFIQFVFKYILKTAMSRTSYFKHFLKRYGGTFLLKCNYEFKDLNVSLNGFYSELLLWWEEFRNTFADMNYTQKIIWNNKDIRIDNKSVFYQTYYDNGIVYVDLLFDFDNKRSCDFYKRKGLNTDFLTDGFEIICSERT